MPTTKSVRYKEITGFPRYRVGDDGSLWSITSGEWKKLKGSPDIYGYIRYGLCRDSKIFPMKGHRAVLTEFCSARPKGMWARHLNGNPADNRLENLAWDTPGKNGQDRIRHGTQTRGEEIAWLVKLTERQVAEIKRRIVDGDIWYRLSKEYQVSPVTIGDIASGKTWKHVPWPANHGPVKRNRRIAPNAYLTEKEVREIKRRLRESEPLKEIASSYGISRDAIYSIKRGKNWGWVTLT